MALWQIVPPILHQSVVQEAIGHFWPELSRESLHQRLQHHGQFLSALHMPSPCRSHIAANTVQSDIYKAGVNYNNENKYTHTVIHMYQLQFSTFLRNPRTFRKKCSDVKRPLFAHVTNYAFSVQTGVLMFVNSVKQITHRIHIAILCSCVSPK